MSHFNSRSRVEQRRKDARKRQEKDLQEVEEALSTEKPGKYKGEKLSKKVLESKKKKAEEDIENAKQKH